MSGPVQIEASNPATDHRDKEIERLRAQRVSMSNTKRKLEVAPLPGFYLYWFHESNVPDALAAGYQFVKRGEVTLNPLAQSMSTEGSDMGSNISLVADKMESGQPARAYLMKLYEELHQDDMKRLEERNALILQAIFGDEAMIGADGTIEAKGPTVYKKALYNRPTRKAKIGAAGQKS
jgi:hypothetical protein